MIAALGDSLTAGFGLPAEEGFVPQLSRWLAQRGVDARLVNAGVSGDTTAGGLARIDWTLTEEVDAVILALGGNDLLRGIDPAVSRQNLRDILSRIDERGLPVLLIGIDAPSNYGAEFEAEFEGMYAELAREFEAELYPDFFAGIAATGDRATALKKYIQPDGIHPNAAGVALMVEDVGPAVLRLIERARGN